MNMGFLSPGVGMMQNVATPACDKKRSAVPHSPFRDWATSQLCLGDEIDSPGQALAASHSLLSPGYADMPVKMCVSPPTPQASLVPTIDSWCG